MLSRQGLQDVLDVVMGGKYTYPKPTGYLSIEIPGYLQLEGIVPASCYLGHS